MVEARTITLEEHPEVPWLSVVLAYGPLVPFAAGAIAALVLGGRARSEAVLLTGLWDGAILAFLAGVRRGLSFRTEGGPTVTQIATMFSLYVIALAALVAVAHGWSRWGAALLLVGFGAIGLSDPIAARSGEAPLFFARLRPVQMALAAATLVLLNIAVWVR